MKKLGLIFSVFLLSQIFFVPQGWCPPTPPGVTVTEVDGSPSVRANKIKFPNGSVTDNHDGSVNVTGSGGGGGDASTNTSVAVVNEIPLFADTSGKLLKRATLTGIPYLTSGVMTGITPGTGVVTAMGNAINAASGFVTLDSSLNLNIPAGGGIVLTPTNGTASASGLYNANNTSHPYQIYTMGPTDMTESFALQFSATEPAGSIPVYGTPAGSGGPGGVKVSPQTWIIPAANIATFLATPSSANFAAAITDETGSGPAVFGTNPNLTGPGYPAYASTGTTDQGTKNINIDGASYSSYYYSPLAGTAATYTPVITAAPGSGIVRFIKLKIGGGTNGTTITWTNVDAIGTAFATTVASGKFNHYACEIPTSGNAQCAIVAEGSSK